jgi:hypothetical protein
MIWFARDAGQGRKSCRLRTKKEKGPWVAFDLAGSAAGGDALRKGRRLLAVAPTHYTVRHGGNADEGPLRSWVLEVLIHLFVFDYLICVVEIGTFS